MTIHVGGRTYGDKQDLDGTDPLKPDEKITLDDPHDPVRVDGRHVNFPIARDPEARYERIDGIQISGGHDGFCQAVRWKISDTAAGGSEKAAKPTEN